MDDLPPPPPPRTFEKIFERKMQELKKRLEENPYEFEQYGPPLYEDTTHCFQVIPKRTAKAMEEMDQEERERGMQI